MAHLVWLTFVVAVMVTQELVTALPDVLKMAVINVEVVIVDID